MGPPRIEPRNRFSFLISPYGILRLVPVIKRRFHSHNRLHCLFYLLFRKPSDMHKVTKYLPLLKTQLLLIRHCLELTAAAYPCIIAKRLYTKRRRL